MTGAHVKSVSALKDVKAAVAEFIETVSSSLASVDADIQRMNQWLTHERPGHWKREVRKREEQLTLAKTAVMRKVIIAAPEPASVVEERKAVDRMQRRLDSARRKLESVRRWAPVWEREAELYKSSCNELVEAALGTLPLAKARLDRMVESLEAYSKIAPPTELGGGDESDTTEPTEPAGDESEK